MKLFISDIKFIGRKPLLLTALLSPVIFTLFLLYLFPIISGLFRSEDIYIYGRYYSVTAVTLISAIPFIYGLLFSFIHLFKPHLSDKNTTEKTNIETKNLLITRIVAGTFLSFIMVLSVIYLTDSVATEGWLRSIYAAFLLALTEPFIFLFTAGLLVTRKNWQLVFLISLLFLITIPSGLLLHHPWNYFAFFSPFYWVSWAWVIGSPAESLIYGVISMTITSVSVLIFYHIFLRDSGTV